MVFYVLNLFVLLIFLFSLSHAQKGKYKICTTDKFASECDTLGRGDSEVSCVIVQDLVECINKLAVGNATFAVANAEQGVLLSSFPQSNDVVVIGDIRNKDYGRNFTAYETVVIVNQKYESERQFRGKTFYHSGFFVDDVVSEYILKSFEKSVLANDNVNQCKFNASTTIEREIAVLHDYFGDSCRPGPWTSDVTLDTELKQKYSRLCKLCPNQSCDIKFNNVENSRKAAIDAVWQGSAFVAVTSAQALQEYNSNNVNKLDNIYILCPNQRIERFGRNMCSWVRQPWDLVIANRGLSEELRSFLRNNLGDYLFVPPTPFAAPGSPRAIPQSALATVMQLKNGDLVLVNATGSIPNVKDFIESYRPLPTTPTPRQECNNDVKLCVSSPDELEKCNWLRQASLNRGIQPLLTCVSETETLDCLNNINEGKSDFAVIDANYGYMAKRKQLQSVAYTEVKEEDLKRVYIFINSNNITKFEDLRHKKACFPEYGGLAWFSFVDWTRAQIRTESCDYGKFISKYVSSACIPGVKDEDHGKTKDTDEEKLCELCQRNDELSATAANCNAGIENRFYNNTGAAICLKEGIADYIVVEGSLKELRKIPHLEEFHALCKSGVLAAGKGVDVDKSCSLSETIDSEIVTRRGDPRSYEYLVLLREWDRWFVRVNPKQSFNLLRPFNGKTDLLFKSTAIGFDSANSSNPDIKNFVALYEHIDNCVEEGKDGALQHTISVVILITFLIVTYFV